MDHPAGRRPLSGDLIPAGLDATLVLVRHGQSRLITEGRFQGRIDSPLSELGIAQARAVADRLAHPGAAAVPLPIPEGPPAAIVHSPLSRAAATAEAIAAAIASARGGTGGGASPAAPGARPDARFLEIGQGDWEGRHRDDIARDDGERLAAWRRTPVTTWAPGGESLPHAQARVRPAITDLLTRMVGGPTPPADFVPGYGRPPRPGPWSVLVGHDGIFKIVLLTLFDLPLERFWMWSFELCGISIIDIRAGRPILRALNLTDHLAALPSRAAGGTTDAATNRGGAL